MTRRSFRPWIKVKKNDFRVVLNAEVPPSLLGGLADFDGPRRAMGRDIIIPRQ